MSCLPNRKRQSTTVLFQSCAKDGTLYELLPVDETSIWQKKFHSKLVLQTFLQEKPSENPLQQNWNLFSDEWMLSCKMFKIRVNCWPGCQNKRLQFDKNPRSTKTMLIFRTLLPKNPTKTSLPLTKTWWAFPTKLSEKNGPPEVKSWWLRLNGTSQAKSC